MRRRNKMYRSIDVYRAQPIGDKEAPWCQIEIGVPIPRRETLEEGAFLFELDAKQLEFALHESLPGGTYDRLLGLMLKRKASHFIVSHTKLEIEEVPGE